MLLLRHVALITKLADFDGFMFIIPNCEYSFAIIVSLMNEECMKYMLLMSINKKCLFQLKSFIVHQQENSEQSELFRLFLKQTRSLVLIIKHIFKLPVNVQDHKRARAGFIA